MIQSLPILRASFAAVLLLPGAFAQDFELIDTEARWRFSLEDVDLDSTGKATLLGLHYEVFGLLDTPGLFGGIGGYGSVNGDLGGFFAAGLDLGYRHHLAETLSLQVGLFAGASGGAGISGTGGLALRPFVALEQQFDSFGLRVEAANMHMPGSPYDETTFSFGLTVPGHFLTGRGRNTWASPISIDALDFERWELQPSVLRLKPTSGSERLSGAGFDDDIYMGGLKVNATLNESNHIPVELWGGATGGIAGFRAILAGYGLHGPLFDSIVSDGLSWEIELLGGLGGGGDVDTGGGFLLKSSAGLRARFTPNWSAHVAINYIDAPNGDFAASGFQFGAAWGPRALHITRGYDRSQLATHSLPASEGRFDIWQLGTAWKIYRPRGSARLQNGRSFNPTQHLAGVSAERHLNEHFSVLARAFAAVEGNMGGYSEGLAGMRTTFSPFAILGESEIYVEYSIGAAGGGSVDVGSGLVHQISTGLAWSPFVGVEFGLGVGRINALHRGSFDASVVEAGLSFDIARILSRR